MKERPILFNGAMVRAILAGNKTQTRREVKHQPRRSDLLPCYVFPKNKEQANSFWPAGFLYPNAKDEVLSLCPYGQVGDRLWVRETWAQTDGSHEILPLAYRATYDGRALIDDRWRPSIHMPRWASRITLEIVNVRVERLQDISETDALEEGITYNDLPNNALDPARARTWFRGLWAKINGFESYQANPWVWAIEFKRIDGGAA